MKTKILRISLLSLLSTILLVGSFFLYKKLTNSEKEITKIEITETGESFSCVQLGDSTNVLPMGFMQRKSTNTPKTIPIVVHVLYTDAIPGTYIDPSTIPQAIEQLNVDFQGTNINFILAGFDYKDLRDYLWHDGYVSGSVCFPSYQTQATQVSNDLKWDLREYCNVYVIPKTCSTILGYAYVGFIPYNSDDGVWVKTETFGVGQLPHLNPKYNENETLTHELGHYCGLFHTFSNNPGQCGKHDPNIDCLYEGDYVCDTAPTKPSTGCVKKGVPGFNCPEVIYDGAFFEVNNHMDYCSQECRDKFTIGQINRMHLMLEYQRYELYTGDEVKPFCFGDCDRDGNVGTSDLMILLANFNCIGCGPSQGDINLDYRITTHDLNWLLSNWGSTCEK